MENKSLSTLLFEEKSLTEKILELDGELPAELEEQINALELQTKEKVDRVVYVIKNLDAQRLILKAQKEQIENAISACDNLQDRIKDRVKQVITQNDKTSVEGINNKMSLKNCKDKVVIFDEAALPESMKKEMVITKTVPDKEKILDSLILGEVVPGAKIEKVKSLTISIKKE